MTTGNQIKAVLLMTMVGVMAPLGETRGQVLRPEGPAEQVGQVVGGALDTAGRAVERSLRTAFARTRGAVESMEVTSRVYSRLLWDKDLNGGRFVIDARPGGVVILRGSVPSQEASDRAVALAASTVGVSQVFNELVAPGSTRGVVPGSSTDPSVGTPLSEPGLEPLPRPAPLTGNEPGLEPLPRPEPAPESGLEPLPRPNPLPAPSPSPEPEDEIEIEVEPTPSIRPPLPTP